MRLSGFLFHSVDRCRRSPERRRPPQQFPALAISGHPASVWIYHFEQNPKLASAAGRVIENLEAGKFRGNASELTLLELTVRPLQLGRQDVADDYEVLLGYFPNLELQPISSEVLLEAAGLRARYRLRTPDAIQIATGLRYGATLAVTNDDAWRNLPLIETVMLSNLIE